MSQERGTCSGCSARGTGGGGRMVSTLREVEGMGHLTMMKIMLVMVEVSFRCYEGREHAVPSRGWLVRWQRYGHE